MKSKSLLIIILVLLAGAGYYYWQHAQPDSAAVSPAVKSAAESGDDSDEVQYPVPAAAADTSAATGAPTTIPNSLDQSDDTLEHQLNELVGPGKLESLINLQDLIRHFVATVDNAGGNHLASRVSPFKPLESEFAVSENAGVTTISPENYARYSPYVDLMTAVDSQKLVDIYTHYYPLFQSAYRELGMKGYFNDRLVKVIDKALDTPIIKEPIALHSSGYYQFADPHLESRPIVQKILLRLGPQQEERVQQKLHELRDLLTHLNKK